MILILAKDQGGIKPHLLGALVIMEAFHYITSEKMSEAEILLNKVCTIFVGFCYDIFLFSLFCLFHLDFCYKLHSVWICHLII